jgi:hypothetical protein
MLGDGALSLKEFIMGEPLPLATIHEAILEFLRGREDVVLFGAQAVNAYVDEPRMTQDVDALSPRAAELAEELRRHLSERFHIALRVRKAQSGADYRLYQLREPKNRHLADIRLTETVPPFEQVQGLRILRPDALVASKVLAYHQRRGRPKSGTDWRDLAELLLKFPHLKSDPGPVTESLRATGASAEVLGTWRQIAGQDIVPEPDEDL